VIRGVRQTTTIRTLVDTPNRTIHVVALDETRIIPTSFSGHPYCCLLWDHEGRSGRESQAAVAHDLVSSGCRYVVCGGTNCEAWHDAIDDACITFDSSGKIVDGPLVMTTWHDGESPEEVAQFFIRCTGVGDIKFTRFLIVHVGRGPSDQALDQAVRANAVEHDAV
jgi:hypothetical protein